MSTTEAMNVFETTTATFLGQYSTGLPKDEVMKALSGTLRFDDTSSEAIATAAVIIVDAFTDQDYSSRGLHRLNGNRSKQKKALEAMKRAQGKSLKLQVLRGLAAEDKAGCLRAVLRQLPDTIFPHSQREALRDFGGMLCSSHQPETVARVVKALRILTYFIPETHKQCLRKLIAHFHEISSRANENSMDVASLAIVFCPIVFPVSSNLVIEDFKDDLDGFKRIFALLLERSGELFSLPDEIIDTLGSTMDAVNKSESPELYSPEEDAQLIMSVTYVDKSATPSKPSTEYEMAALMANVYNMPEGEEKQRLMRRLQKSQRKQIGVPSKSWNPLSIFKRAAGQ